MSKQRQSNMELLRIVAMFLVLIVHSDYFSLGAPTRVDIISSPIASITRVAFESLGLICVNLFIFISGWFGITLRRHKIGDLLFQVLYFLIGVYVITLLLGHASIDSKSIIALFRLGNWFIPAYLVLCIIAPALNAFISSANRKHFRFVLIAFFTIQTICGWLGKSNVFGGGYSTISFIGIYLIAQYIRKYNTAEHFSKEILSLIFIGCILLNTLIGLGSAYVGIENWLFEPYLNPFNIIATVSFALFFTKISLQSNFINFIAKSAFAVFLFHTNFNIFDNFAQINRNIYLNNSGITVLVLIFFTCCAWFIAAVILDQPRKLLWKLIENRNRKAKTCIQSADAN